MPKFVPGPGISRFLKSQDTCRIASVSPDGFPHCVPVGYFYDDGMIYIATRADSRKSRNLQRDARCCVVVDVLKGGVGKGLMLTGKAEIAKGAEFRRLKVRIGKLAGWHLDRWDVGGHSPDSMIVFRPAKAATIGQI